MTKSKVATPLGPAKVTCRLNQKHTHGGIDYAVGAVIELREDQALRLAAAGVLQPTTP